MIRSRPLVPLCAAALALVASLATARAAEIHVMISGGFSAAYDELVPVYEKASGNRVVTERGPSMGETPQAIPNRLARGEAADLVIMVDAGLDSLIAKHLAREGSRVDLASATIWMAVRDGAPKPDISTVDAFRRTLKDAKSIAYSDSASGVYLEKTLWPKLDPDGSLRAKSRMIPAEPVGRVIARGDAELGFQQRSELQPVPGHHDRRPDPGRGAEGHDVRRGHRERREGGRRGARPGPLPRLARRTVGDRPERDGAGRRDDDGAGVPLTRVDRPIIGSSASTSGSASGSTRCRPRSAGTASCSAGLIVSLGISLAGPMAKGFHRV